MTAHARPLVLVTVAAAVALGACKTYTRYHMPKDTPGGEEALRLCKTRCDARAAEGRSAYLRCVKTCPGVKTERGERCDERTSSRALLCEERARTNWKHIGIGLGAVAAIGLLVIIGLSAAGTGF